MDGRVESRPNEWQKLARSHAGPSQRRDWSVAHRALAALPTGGWTTVGEVAALVKTSAGWVGRHFYEHRNDDATIRMFNSDGSIWKWARTQGDEEQDLAAIRTELAACGISLGTDDKPSQAGFHSAQALKQLAEIVGE